MNTRLTLKPTIHNLYKNKMRVKKKKKERKSILQEFCWIFFSSLFNFQLDIHLPVASPFLALRRLTIFLHSCHINDILLCEKQVICKSFFQAFNFTSQSLSWCANRNSHACCILFADFDFKSVLEPPWVDWLLNTTWKRRKSLFSASSPGSINHGIYREGR